jgi:outer membrane protein OmpA-like peptidoglycan-associated protein
MAFDLNKKVEKKKFDLTKSKDAVPEIDASKEKAVAASGPDLAKKKSDLTSKPGLVKKKEEIHKAALAKERTDAPAKNPENKKSVPRIFYLLGVLVLGVGIWYFIADADPGNAPSSSTTEAKTNPSSPAPLNNSSGNPSPPPADKNAPVNPEIKSSAPVTVASLNNKVLANFEPGASSLISVDDITVSSIAGYLSQNPDSKLTVYGFASSEGDFSFNQLLSQQRADACKSYLVGKGIASDRVIAIGKGIEDPVSSNSTAEGRMKNRRVEIVLK